MQKGQKTQKNEKILKKSAKKFGGNKKMSTFAIPFEKTVKQVH